MTTTAIKERPILFSAPMVRAILNGSKTQTRRIVTQGNSECAMPWDRLVWRDSELATGIERPAVWRDNGYLHVAARPHPDDDQNDPDFWTVQRVYPRHEVGDRLWVRETWQHECTHCDDHKCGNPEHIFYRATDPSPDTFASWRPSIFMQRWASRLVLELTDVRVQRVQAIAEADVRSEGVQVLGYGDYPDEFSGIHLFRDLWDSINGERDGCSWDANPWVWCVSFRRVESEDSQ